MAIQVYAAEQQGTGFFDGGLIVEQKPIGFPGEGTAVKRVGPLFYWAWAESKNTGFIPEHPHKAFEILTYVLQGDVEHGDSLGTRQRVGAGGVQLIQAGSGVYHSERLLDQTELFQIWFEPDIRETLKHPPAYSQFDHDAFPVVMGEGVRVKKVIGDEAPISLVTKASMVDIEIAAGQTYSYPLAPGNALAAVIVSGNGTIQLSEESQSLKARDFLVAEAGNTGKAGADVKDEENGEIVIVSGQTEPLRLVAIEVPMQVGYDLYRK